MMKTMLALAAMLVLAVCAGADQTSIYQGYVRVNLTGQWEKCNGATVWSSAPYSNSTQTPCSGCGDGYYSIPAYPTPPSGTYKVQASKTIGGSAYGDCKWYGYVGEHTTFNADLYMTSPPYLCDESK
jgi:hypothetical protein